MSTKAVAGHGATIAIELLPAGSPGVFTVIAELNGDITWPGLSRSMTEVTPHQDDIDSYVAGRLGRESLSFSTNYIFNDTTHDHLTGLQKKIISNELFGVRLRGPGGTANTDEVIASGRVESIGHVDPVREGARTADVSIKLTKGQKIDGVQVGNS